MSQKTNKSTTEPRKEHNEILARLDTIIDLLVALNGKTDKIPFKGIDLSKFV